MENQNNEIIGASIKRLRKERGLTQSELASRINRKLSTVQKYESGSITPPVQVLDSIAEALGIHIFDLIRGDDKLKKEYLEAVFPPLTMEINIESGEDTLISNYQRLNHTGKEEAQKRVSELTEITRYTEEEK